MNPALIVKAAIRFHATKRSWLGDGGVPVERELAQQRASVCLQCPKNQHHTLWEFLTVPAIESLYRQLRVKDEMKLKLDDETKLHVCEVCWCPLPTKVWVPIEHIGDNPNDMPEHCWIRAESEKK